MNNKIIIVKDMEIIKQSLFPETADQIDEWAKRFGFLNSYNTIDDAPGKIGKYQKGIIESLQQALPLTKEQKLFIQKTEAAVDIVNTLEIHPDLKRTIINEVVVNTTPWLLEGPIAHMPKQIRIIEIIKDKSVEILSMDDIICCGFSSYSERNNPKEVYEHCLTLQDFDEIEKKIIAFALNRKPYFWNQSLRGTEAISTNKIPIDRERGLIGFEGPGLDSGFNKMYFLLSIFSREEYGEFVYEKPIDQKKDFVRNSERFKTFVPDFESGK